MASRKRIGAASACAALAAALTYAGTTATPAGAAHSHCTKEAATILGTPGDDVLEGTDRQDIILGLGGDDRIVAGGSDNEYQYDRICGGAGDDVLVGHQESTADDPHTETNAVVVGGPGDDRLLGGIELNGGPGNDELRGGEGRDQLWGGPGNDVIDGGKPDDGPGYTVDAAIFREGPIHANLVTHRARGEGRDRLIGIEQLIGTSQADVFRGDEDGNFLDGRGGSDTLIGGGGKDTLVPDGLNDGEGASVMETVDGGPGRDTLALDGYYDAAVVDLERGTMRVGEPNRARLTGVEDVIGTGRNDTMTGNDADNSFFGQLGSDTLRGGGGDDHLVGDDTSNAGVDVLHGEAGDDVLEGLKGSDELDGGDGTDTASFFGNGYLGGVDASLVTGRATGQGADQLSGIENLWGSRRQDRLEGDGGDNELRSNGGEDFSDTLIGHAGDDVLVSGRDDDTLDGGDGTDLASYAGSYYPVTVDLAAGTARTEDAVDALLSIEHAIGSDGNDVISGDESGNLLDGLEGDDTIFGRGGDDTLVGGIGVDTVDGGTGTDECTEAEATIACE